jgi:hypothetical protein
MLRNPFYVGIMRIKSSGESYVGIHKPIISKAVFDRVQQNLDGKKNRSTTIHDFMFRRMISCTNCRRSLIGERQKGHVYYRCQTKGCPTLTIREELVVSAFQSRLQPLQFEEEEIAELRSMIAAYFDQRQEHRNEHVSAINLRIEASRARLSRLVDVYTDNMIEKSLFGEKKLALLMEQKELEEERDLITGNKSHFAQKLDEILELLKSVPLSYEMANPVKKQFLLKEITSNIRLDRKNLDIALRSPFQELGNVPTVSTCGHVRDESRTARVQSIFDVLIKYCERDTLDRPLDTPLDTVSIPPMQGFKNDSPQCSKDLGEARFGSLQP